MKKMHFIRDLHCSEFRFAPPSKSRTKSPLKINIRHSYFPSIFEREVILIQISSRTQTLLISISLKAMANSSFRAQRAVPIGRRKLSLSRQDQMSTSLKRRVIMQQASSFSLLTILQHFVLRIAANRTQVSITCHNFSRKSSGRRRFPGPGSH